MYCQSGEWPTFPLHRNALTGTDPLELELRGRSGGTWFIDIYGQREPLVDTQLRLVPRRSALSSVPHLPKSLHISTIVRPHSPILAGLRYGFCYSNPNNGAYGCSLRRI